MLVILNMLGAVAALAGAFRAVAEKRAGRILAVEFADAALVLDFLRRCFDRCLVGAAAVALFPFLEMFFAKEHQVI